VALSVAALAAGTAYGAASLATIVLAQVGLTIGLVGSFTSGPQRLDGRVHLLSAVGWIVFFALIFVFYSYRDRVDFLWPIAGAIVVLPSLLARETTPPRTLRPALAAARLPRCLRPDGHGAGRQRDPEPVSGPRILVRHSPAPEQRAQPRLRVGGRRRAGRPAHLRHHALHGIRGVRRRARGASRRVRAVLGEATAQHPRRRLQCASAGRHDHATRVLRPRRCRR